MQSPYTIDVGSGYRAIRGTQDSSTNNGLPISIVTILPNTAVFLVSIAAYSTTSQESTGQATTGQVATVQATTTWSASSGQSVTGQVTVGVASTTAEKSAILSKSSFPPGAIAGIVVALAAIFIIAVAVFLFLRR